MTMAVFDFEDIRRRRDIRLGMEPNGTVHGEAPKIQNKPWTEDRNGRPLNWRMAQHEAAERKKKGHDSFKNLKHLTDELLKTAMPPQFVMRKPEQDFKFCRENDRVTWNAPWPPKVGDRVRLIEDPKLVVIIEGKHFNGDYHVSDRILGRITVPKAHMLANYELVPTIYGWDLARGS